MTAVLDPFNDQVSFTQFQNLHAPHYTWSINLFFIHIKNVGIRRFTRLESFISD